MVPVTNHVPLCLSNAPFCQEPEDQLYYEKFLSLPEVRQAIHVGNRTFNDGTVVQKYLQEDAVQSVKPWLTEIMNNYKVRKLLQLLSILGTFRLPVWR